jgi:hypothetical protein
MYVENIYYCLYRLTPLIIEAPLDVYLLVERDHNHSIYNYL